MARKMSREGRWLDIITFLHRKSLVLAEGATIGEYCRQAGLAMSPYITGEFDELRNQGILTVTAEQYKATWRNVYRLYYENISEFYPQIHETITAIGVQHKLPL